jgi:hypothetical protein
VNGLVRRGHRVLASLRDPAVAAGGFDPAITVLPARSVASDRFARFTNSFVGIIADFALTMRSASRACAGRARALPV